MSTSPRRAVYVISVAAELVGVHPQTLRNYERAGLLDPLRTRGGSRLFSDADLVRLSHIIELSGAGVNLEGVRRILELESKLEDALQESKTRPAATTATALVHDPASRSLVVRVVRHPG